MSMFIIIWSVTIANEAAQAAEDSRLMCRLSDTFYGLCYNPVKGGAAVMFAYSVLLYLFKYLLMS